MQSIKRDWKKYNKSLVNRGSINLWLDEKALAAWHATYVKNKIGRPFQFSDDAIKLLATVRYLFKMPLRTTEGFLRSLFLQLKIDLLIPSYSQVCKRMKKIILPSHLQKGIKVTDIVLDTTGLKVFGEGEWKVKKHGTAVRRTWRKLHLAVNADTQEILFSKITKEHSPDTTFIPEILKSRKGIKNFLLDGVGDKSWLYKMFLENKINLLTPPQKNAKIRREDWMQVRNKNILQIRSLGGDKIAKSIWSKLSGYNKRVTVESAIARWKRLFGSALQSINGQNQDLEIALKSRILNKIKVA